MPRNSPTGFVCAFFATVMGFALIWHIWWMVIAGVIGAFATFVVFAWRDQDEYEIPADEVARIDRANIARARATWSPPRGACHEHATATMAPGRSASPVGALDADRASGPGAEADRHRLRLLDLPAQRHRHVLVLLRGLRRAVGTDRRRPDGRGTVRSAQRRDRNRAACCCRASPAAWPASPPTCATSSGSRSRWR